MKDNWHLERSVSASHIIATLTLLGSLAAVYSTTNSRLAILEAQQGHFNSQIVAILENQRATDVRQDLEISEMKKLLREDLREINANIAQLTREISQ